MLGRSRSWRACSEVTGAWRPQPITGFVRWSIAKRLAATIVVPARRGVAIGASFTSAWTTPGVRAASRVVVSRTGALVPSRSHPAVGPDPL